jgi:hypothetical protein
LTGDGGGGGGGRDGSRKKEKEKGHAIVKEGSLKRPNDDM